MGLGEEKCNMPFSSSLIHSGNMIYHCWRCPDHLAQTVFVRFLSFPSLSVSSHCQGSHYVQPPHQEWEIVPHLLEKGIATYIICDSSALEICPFCPAYLPIQSFISLWTHGYWFIIWVIIQSTFSCSIGVQLRSMGALSVGSCVPFTYFHHCGVFFLLFVGGWQEHSPNFWHCNMSQAHLVYFLL